MKKRIKKVTKAEIRRVEEYNRELKAVGLPPVLTLRAQKIDRSRIRTTVPLPTYRWSPRPDPSRSIPSHVPTEPNPNATARRSIMEHVLHGGEAPEVTAEIIRKSKCMAPAYNKGAYQYVSDAESAMYAGRKVK